MEELRKITQELPPHEAWVAIRYQIVQHAIIIRGSAHLLLIQGDRTEDQTALLSPIENEAHSIIQGHVREAMQAFERVIFGYAQSPHADESVAPCNAARSFRGQRDEPSLADVLLTLVEQLRETGLQIHEYVEQYKAAHLPSAEQQENLASLERGLHNYFEVLNVILGDVLLSRIRHTLH